MNNDSIWIFILYYLYAIFVVGLFSYVVFWLDKSGWWFIIALLLLNNTPIIRTENEKEKINLEEHDILAIFCAKKLKTKLGTFIRKNRNS